RGADGDVAVMHLGHPAGQSEPETEAPRGSTWRPRPVHLVEGGEHALALFLRNARALVAHRELDRAVVALRREGHRRSAVLGGIVHEIPQRATEQRGIRFEL